MAGGAAARGLPNDTALVYTPNVDPSEGGWRNVTLPHGYFWNEIINPGMGSASGPPLSRFGYLDSGI